MMDIWKACKINVELIAIENRFSSLSCNHSRVDKTSTSFAPQRPLHQGQNVKSFSHKISMFNSYREVLDISKIQDPK